MLGGGGHVIDTSLSNFQGVLGSRHEAERGIAPPVRYTDYTHKPESNEAIDFTVIISCLAVIKLTPSSML